MKPEDIEARLAAQRLRAPRAALRGEILARAAEGKGPRRRPWFAYAVTATIVLSLAVGQVADHLQSRRLAALMGPSSPRVMAASPEIGPAELAALLRHRTEITQLLGLGPSSGVGG